MMGFKYWNTGLKNVKTLLSSIENAKYQIEENMENDDSCDESNGAIVEIHVPDSAGQYAMREFTCRITNITEEEYQAKYKDKDGDWLMDEEVSDFDKLLEDVNEELEKYLKSMELEQEGYNFNVGWEDGSICLMMYAIS